MNELAPLQLPYSCAVDLRKLTCEAACEADGSSNQLLRPLLACSASDGVCPVPIPLVLPQEGGEV